MVNMESINKKLEFREGDVTGAKTLFDSFPRIVGM